MALLRREFFPMVRATKQTRREVMNGAEAIRVRTRP
ncbi:hypothetical protein GGQ72_000578 [Rhizobium rhizoryzae]|jgi:hypothetical protein|uniref:Uncharacterized protein n=1 Tax=Rhizobium rhizoryzae TaxID=451876 RepID=A0A7W6PPQ4_9HYPH|nr:hypothetical protein [Rhizobium rhizoryzae]